MSLLHYYFFQNKKPFKCSYDDITNTTLINCFKLGLIIYYQGSCKTKKVMGKSMGIFSKIILFFLPKKPYILLRNLSHVCSSSNRCSQRSSYMQQLFDETAVTAVGSHPSKPFWPSKLILCVHTYFIYICVQKSFFERFRPAFLAELFVCPAFEIPPRAIPPPSRHVTSSVTSRAGLSRLSASQRNNLT